MSELPGRAGMTYPCATPQLTTPSSMCSTSTYNEQKRKESTGMSQEHKPHSAAEPILDQLRQLMSTVTVFGDTIEHNGLTVIPVARVIAGGGGGQGSDQDAEREGDGGGAGVLARPAGAFIINEGRVAWKPAISIQTVAALALLVFLWIARQK